MNDLRLMATHIRKHYCNQLILFVNKHHLKPTKTQIAMGKKRSEKQERIMLSFMQNNQEIAKGFTKGDRVQIEAKWVELTNSLNAAGPPCKDSAAWKKSWVDWKASIRKKLANNRKESVATGGGPYTQQPISPTEEAVAVLCRLYRAVEGIRGAATFGHSVGEGIEDAEDTVDRASYSDTDASIPERLNNSPDDTEPQSSTRQRRRSNDAFAAVSTDQNALLKRIADTLDESLLLKQKKCRIMEEREQERKRHNKRMEEIEEQKHETLKKFL